MNAMLCQLKQEILMTAQHFGVYSGEHLVDVAPARHGEQIRMAIALGSRVAIRYVDLLNYVDRERIVRDLVADVESPAAYMTKAEIIRRREQGLFLHSEWLG